jgi:hypothetical protein
MKAKLVSEALGDILRPKTVGDIRKDHQQLIYWKNIIEGKKSPQAIKFFLDKDFVRERAKELGWTRRPPTKDWEKHLVWFLDRLDKQKGIKDELLDELRRITYRTKPNEAAAALYIALKTHIDKEFKKLDREVKRRMGKGLKDD